MSDHEKDSAEQLIDLLIYAPLGLALEYRTLLPELAERGRRQLGFARSVGKLALGGLVAQADRTRSATEARAKPSPSPASSDAEPTSEAKLPEAKKAAAKKAPAKKAAAKKAPAKKAAAKKAPAKKAAAKKPAAKKADATASADADIDAVLPTYETLTARNIVGRLDGLNPAQLRIVAAHEGENRQRTTVLNRIEQLLG